MTNKELPKDTMQQYDVLYDVTEAVLLNNR